MANLPHPVMSTKKINRNAPCECGSGKKYKRCCWIAANSNDLQLSAVDVSVHEAIEAATAHQRAGRLQEAENLYNRVLQIAPGNPDALHLSGAISHQRGDHKTAIALISRA